MYGFNKLINQVYDSAKVIEIMKPNILTKTWYNQHNSMY